MRSRVYRFLAGQAWAIRDDAWETIQAVIHRHESGERLTREQIRAAIGADEEDEQPILAQDEEQPVIARISICGPIIPRGNAMSDVSGMASAEMVAKKIRAAGSKENVASVLLDFDCPGGAVTGIQEAAAAIREVRAIKPVVAHANHMACSAAYWLASQASEIVASPSAEVGSIGVFMVHQDLTKMAEKEGVKATFIFAGKNKTEGHPLKALSEDAKLYAQHKIDAIYASMTEDIAEGIGVSASKVRGASFGQGRSLLADEALSVGMVHRIATSEETIARMAADPKSIALRPAARAFVTVPSLPAGMGHELAAMAEIQGAINRQIEVEPEPIANPETIAQDSHVTRPGAAEENEMDETKLAALIAEHTAKAVADAVAPLEAKISGLEATSNKAVEIAQKSAEELAATNKANATALAKGKLDLLVDEGRISPADAAEALEDFPHLPADRWAARIKAFEARDPSFVDLSRPLVVKGANGEPVTVELISLPTANGQSLQYGSDAHDEAAVRAAHTNAKGELDYDAYRAALYARHGERAPVLQ